jgi:ribosomal protein L22
MVDNQNKKMEEEKEKTEDKKDVKKLEEKVVETEKKKDKKEKVVEIKPKDKAFVSGKSLAISPKNCFAICKMIKGITPEKAIAFLEEVVKKKVAVHMQNREVPHRKGAGYAGGRFPRNASLEIIQLLKQLKANASVSLIDNPVITVAKADKAQRPFKRAGKKAKRAHVYIEVKDRNKLNRKKMEKK